MARMTSAYAMPALIFAVFSGLFVETVARQAPSGAPMPEPKSITIPRISSEVKVDGVLDEPAWQKAARASPFLKNETREASRANTEVRLMYDGAALYLGWTIEDTDIQATFKERDSRFWEEEVVEFFVTPAALDKYFELQWNPLGGTFDAIISNKIGPDGRSQGIQGDWSFTASTMRYAIKVDGTVQQSDDRDVRWIAEVRIPFADLHVDPPQPGSVWRGNFYRFNRDRGREAEQLSWSPTIWSGFHQPTRFGYLRFQ